MSKTNNKVKTEDTNSTVSTTFSELFSLNEEFIGGESDNAIDATDHLNSTFKNQSIDSSMGKLSNTLDDTISFNVNDSANSNTGSASTKRKEFPESNKKMASISSLPLVHNSGQTREQNTTNISTDDRKCQGKLRGSSTAVFNTMDKKNSISFPSIASQISSNKARKINFMATPSSSSITSSFSSIDSFDYDSDQNVCQEPSIVSRRTDLMETVFLELQVTGHECFGRVFDERDLSDLSNEGDDIFKSKD